MSEKCYIGGCARNCAKYIPYVMTNILRLTSLMSDYIIIIAYDESTDDTLKTLIQYKKHFFKNKMEIIINKEPLKETRTENICNARNKIHNRINELNIINNWDYFILIDCDDVCSYPININNIMPYFERNKEWDCLTFNRPDYYDIWALSFDHYIIPCWSWKISPKKVVAIMTRSIMEKLSQLKSDELFECESAFNGFAIYKISAFKNCYYEWKMPSLTTYNSILLEKCKIEFELEPYSVDDEGEKDDCEHRSFHKQARDKNGAHIMISPLYAFDEPTPSIAPWIKYWKL